MIAFVAIAFVACVCAHITLVGSTARALGWRAAIGLFVPPIAVYWAWERGMRRRVYVWVLAIVAYALGIALVG